MEKFVKWLKKFLLWFFAILITLAAAVYQRKTGPTYPKELNISLNGKPYELSLVRSLSLDEQSAVKLNIPDTAIKGKLYYKRLNTSDNYSISEFRPGSNKGKHYLFAEVPQQPAAGKLQYYFELSDSTGTRTFFSEEPVIIRYKGSVPAFILIPHILLMFLAMLFSNLAGLMSIVNYPKFRKYGIWTLILLIGGGMILGPAVQYYAFGEYWTGIPFGWDLTDNKTLIALIFWILAVFMNRKSEKPAYTLLAAFVLILIFSIPHSLFGSELNYSTGQVTQG